MLQAPGSPLLIIEIGGGNGTLARDMLVRGYTCTVSLSGCSTLVRHAHELWHLELISLLYGVVYEGHWGIVLCNCLPL